MGVKVGGLYLYCLRRKTEDSPTIFEKGIDGKGEVFTFPYHELEAVVSEVSLEEFESEEIQRKAQENLNWIKEKAIIHEKVIEEAMRRNEGISSVIPMKFGMILKGKEGLEQILNEQYERFKVILEKLEGKQEWGVKIYLADRKKFEQEIKAKSQMIKEKEEALASLPEGIAYFMESELKELISRELEKELKMTLKDVFERFKIVAEQSYEGKILERELTGRVEPMVLNASYLIEKERIEDFKVEADMINHEIKTKGLILEYSGPWPPYHFV